MTMVQSVKTRSAINLSMLRNNLFVCRFHWVRIGEEVTEQLEHKPGELYVGRMSQALTYTYSLFHRLSRYHLDGRYRIDNNLVENTIRPLALGRKNYMFCGNHDTAENAAIMYSLLGCCAASDVNPREWLTYVLTKIPYYNNDYSLDLADLPPHN